MEKREETDVKFKELFEAFEKIHGDKVKIIKITERTGPYTLMYKFRVKLKYYFHIFIHGLTVILKLN